MRVSLRPAFGEIYIADAFISELLGKDKLAFADRVEALELLGQDLVVIPLRGREKGAGQAELQKLAAWRAQGSYYVMALLDGPWERLILEHGWQDVFYYLADRPQEFRQELQAKAKEVLASGAEAVRYGCQGLVLGEDLAFAGGTFLPKSILESVIFPVLRVVALGLRRLIPIVFLHSDGQIDPLWPLVEKCGFTGFHGQLRVDGGQGGDHKDFLHWGGLDPYLNSLAGGTGGPRGYTIIGTSSGLYPGLPPGKVMEAIRKVKGGFQDE